MALAGVTCAELRNPVLRIRWVLGSRRNGPMSDHNTMYKLYIHYILQKLTKTLGDIIFFWVIFIVVFLALSRGPILNLSSESEQIIPVSAILSIFGTFVRSHSITLKLHQNDHFFKNYFSGLNDHFSMQGFNNFLSYRRLLTKVMVIRPKILSPDSFDTVVNHQTVYFWMKNNFFDPNTNFRAKFHKNKYLPVTTAWGSDSNRFRPEKKFSSKNEHFRFFDHNFFFQDLCPNQTIVLINESIILRRKSRFWVFNFWNFGIFSLFKTAIGF